MSDDASTGAPRQARGNGLSARAWVDICDVDPRLVQPLLEALRDAELPAYVAPSTGRSGPYGERVLPDRPTDRLWVDALRRSEAEDLVSSTLPRLHESLEDERWAAIVAELSSAEPAADAGAWPEIEGQVSTSLSYDEPEPAPRPVEEDEHFVPPDPPPPPPAHPVTRYGWTALFGGLALLFVPALLGQPVGGTLLAVAILAIAGGFVTLVLRMKDAPPVDDGPDDGAVV